VVAALAPVATALVTDADLDDLLTPRPGSEFPEVRVAEAVAALLTGDR